MPSLNNSYVKHMKYGTSTGMKFRLNSKNNMGAVDPTSFEVHHSSDQKQALSVGKVVEKARDFDDEISNDGTIFGGSDNGYEEFNVPYRGHSMDNRNINTSQEDQDLNNTLPKGYKRMVKNTKKNKFFSTRILKWRTGF